MLTLETKQFATPRRLLYGPGPSMVDPRVLKAMANPAVGIRDPHFLQLIAEIQTGLRETFGTTNRITFPLPTTGSGGMEAAVGNFVYPGCKFAVFSAGHFAERISEMGRRQRANVVKLEKPWGQVFTASEAEQFIEREKPDVVAFVTAETSTGAYQSGRAIVPAAQKAGALVIADAVTSLGAMPVELDALGIDVSFSCSQKGLSCPAGLSPISVSPRAWEWLGGRIEELFTWYLDLRLHAKYFEPPHAYHHTPSPTLFYALHQALAAIEEEGLQARWDRHQQAGTRLMSGLQKLGFSPVVPEAENRVWHLAVVTPPAGVSEAQIRDRLMDKFDIEIAGGLGQFAGKVLRIGSMGPLANDADVDSLLEAIAASV